MKRKFLLFSLFLFIIGNLLTSCTSEDTIYNKPDIESSETEVTVQKLPPLTEELSTEDANTVVKLFLKDSATRAFSNKTIKNTIQVKGDNSETAFYAVNFNEGGYILVSATTKYHPILAEVE